MSSIDKYIDELRRSGATSVILLSESEPRIRGKAGERALEGKISHKNVTALVEEIVPPDCFADLVMMEPVEFPLSHEAGELSIRVVPGPSIWRVVVEARGDGLAPFPASESGDEETPSQTLSGLGSGVVEAPGGADPDPDPDPDPEPEPEPEPEPDPELDPEPSAAVGIEAVEEPVDGPTSSPVSANPLDEALAKAAEASTATDDDVPLSEVLLADHGDLLDDEDEDIDLASFISDSGEGPLGDHDESGPPAISVDVHSSPNPSGPDNQEHRATKRLQEGEPGADSSLGDADMSAPPPLASQPVEPLEIDFTEGDVPQHAIEGLDMLLDAAWSQGATGLLLRDDCVPLLVRGTTVSELPFARPDEAHLVRDIVDIVASPSQAEQLEIMGQCRFVYLTGSSTRVRCTLVQDGGTLAASVRRIGDEHLPDNSQKWMSDAVRNVLPPHGLILVCGAPGQGKTTTAMALAAVAHEVSPRTVLVGDPLERRLVGRGAGLVQRGIPDDAPNCAQALQGVFMLEAPLVLVDVPRPDKEALAMLSLAAQGRVVIATWTAPHCVEAIQGLMDALPPDLAPAERARRARSLVAVIAVQLVPTTSGGVLPLFEVLRTNPALLGAVADSRLDTLRGTEIRQLTFESSRAILVDRGLLSPE